MASKPTTHLHLWVAATLCLFAFLPGCAWWQAPAVDDAFTSPADVIAPDSEKVSGQIALTDSGLWALVWESSQRRGDVQPGQFVRVRSLEDDSFDAQFAVALQRKWGVLLQRLDGGPVPMEIGDVEVQILAAEQLEQACVGSRDEWPTAECLADHGVPSAWDIYELSGDRLRAAGEPTSWRGAMPFERVGVAAVTELDASSVDSTAFSPPQKWLAVRRQKRRLPNYRTAAIVADERCRAHKSVLERAGLDVSFADIGAASDALDIELEAATHRSDGVVLCPDSGNLVFFAPVVFRPVLSVPYTNFRGVSLLGWRPVEVSPDNGDAVMLAARLTTSVASGRFDRADFYVERLVHVLPEKRARRIALLSAPIAASAERPELALRRLQYGAEGMWNPERSVPHQLAKAWALAAFDRPRRALMEMKNVDALIAKSRSEAWLQHWRTWTELRAFAAAYSRRSSAEDGFRQARSYFEDIPGAQSWREAADWMRWSELGGELPFVEGADERFELFRKAARGDTDTCEGCRLDPLGLDAYAWASTYDASTSAAMLDQIGRLPMLAVRPGITRVAIAESGGRELPLGLQAAFASLAPGRELDATLTSSLEALGAASRCDQDASALSDRHLLANVLQLRGEERDRQSLKTAHWLVTTGLELACSDASALVAKVARRTEQRSPDAAILAAFTTRVLAAVPDSRLTADDASLMGAAAKAGGMGEACMLWNQAAALAALRRGRTKLADDFLISSVDCHDTEVPSDLAESEAYLGALLHYERTRRVPGQLHDDVARRLAVATRHRLRDENVCAGTADVDYWMAAGVSRRVAELADLVAVEAVEEEDGLRLQTASRTAARAEASLHAARRALTEGRPALAARLLRDAHSDFRSVAHEPGLARTRLLVAVVYGEDFDSFVEQEAETTPRSNPEPLDGNATAAAWLRAGKARALLDGSGPEQVSDRIKLAAAVVLGAQKEVEALLSESRDLRASTFCQPLRAR